MQKISHPSLLRARQALDWLFDQEFGQSAWRSPGRLNLDDRCLNLYRKEYYLGKMKRTGLPTLQDIETLTSYLPRLYAEGFLPILKWEGGEKLKDGSYSMHYPNYNPLVEEFMNTVRGPWIDYEYNPEQAYQMLKDEQAVKSATLAQIKSMLTFCVRGERFSDGHWAAMIEKGYIRRILERLNVIKTEQRREEGQE